MYLLCSAVSRSHDDQRSSFHACLRACAWLGALAHGRIQTRPFPSFHPLAPFHSHEPVSCTDDISIYFPGESICADMCAGPLPPLLWPIILMSADHCYRFNQGCCTSPSHIPMELGWESSYHKRSHRIQIPNICNAGICRQLLLHCDGWQQCNTHN